MQHSTGASRVFVWTFATMQASENECKEQAVVRLEVRVKEEQESHAWLLQGALDGLQARSGLWIQLSARGSVL
jgi:hypothetical protein